MQENVEFAEKAIADWEQIKISGFWKIFIEKLDLLYVNAAKSAAMTLDLDEVLRYQGEYRVIGQIGRLPDNIVKELRESGIPNVVSPDLK